MSRFWMAAALPALLFSTQTLAQGRQGPSQEELIKRRDAKLAESWIAHGGWSTDWDKARAQATKSGELIFAYFTRSYTP